MGGGGQVQQPTATTTSTTDDNAVASKATSMPTKKFAMAGTLVGPDIDPRARAKELNDWVSPFGPEKIDPRHRADYNEALPGKTAEIIQRINSEFPTKSELRNVIPKHCFERSALRSMSYVVRDVLQGALVVYITHKVIGLSTDPPEGGLLFNPLGWLVWRLAWNIYAAVMTMACGGLWVLAHECGHGAFSEHAWLNAIVGWTFHSIMLVPYFSWAFSHAKHHRRTNDLVDGETHIPPVYTEMGLNEDKSRIPREVIKQKIYGGGFHQAAVNNLVGHARAHDAFGDEGFAIFMMWSRLFWAWQIYLCGVKSTGLHDHKGNVIDKGTFPDHFRPHSRMFPPKMYWKVVASDVGIGIVISTLVYCSYMYGFRAVWMWYFGPYMLTNCFLVTVTWLHHTDPTVPHFDAENWTWMKGALAGTIDRPLYWWMNSFSHNISTTHVVHHLFHEIPHYHAVEATKHVRAYLEPKGLYNFDPTDACMALWNVCRRCHYVDSMKNGVQYYQSFEEIPRTNDNKKSDAATPVEETKKEQ